MRKILRCISLFTALASVLMIPNAAVAQAPTAHTTKNVLIVMIDGFRWEEVFHGVDTGLLVKPTPDGMGDPKETAAKARAHYARSTPTESRRALMPFLWNTIAKQGQIFGNRDLGSDSHVINGLNFSYPGYAETLTGLADPRIDSNANVPNPNPTVLTWLNRQPGLEGRVAAFGAWEVFNGIFDREHCGFVVNAGWDPLTSIPATPELTLLNQLKAETPHVWGDEPFDALPFHTAIEYLKAKKPRVFFLGLGETDDWAHNGIYTSYLDSAHLADSYIEELWNLVQSMPEYHGTTTLIVLPDHGRGLGAEWNDHGGSIPASRETWMAFLGPDTPALGERGAGTVVTDSQVAATLAALLGEDYHREVPKSGVPIADVFSK